MMTAHTPGPWTISPPALRHMEAMILAAPTHPEMRATDSLCIAHVDSVDGFGANGIGESAANARLIAAAPALYTALRLYFSEPARFHKAASDALALVDGAA
jgi:hypothetical protein